MTPRLRVVEQGSDRLVLGTDVLTEAAAMLPPRSEWAGSFPGKFARRRGRWVEAGGNPDCYPPVPPPKDARPGALFVAVRQRCANCDDSGYVHTMAGELLGVCPCPAGGEGTTDG